MISYFGRKLTVALASIVESKSKNVHWYVPRPVSSIFTGRSELLQQISTAIEPTANSALQKRFIITGIGGMGKSEICLKVADLVREKYVIISTKKSAI
jgi:hypothetical protein